VPCTRPQYWPWRNSGVAGFTENAPGVATHLTMAIKQSTTAHEVQWGKVEAWLQGDGRSPAE
jgi:hypothetical protein